MIYITPQFFNKIFPKKILIFFHIIINKNKVDTMEKNLISQTGTYAQIASLFGSIILFVFIMLLLLICRTITNYVIFKRAGLPGVYSAVPIAKSFYFSEIMFGRKIYAWLKFSFFISAIVALKAQECGVNPGSVGYSVIGVIELMGFTAWMYYRVAFYRNLAKCFGKGTKTAVGLFFMPTVFRIILLVKDAQYTEPGDFLNIWDKFLFKQRK